MRTNITLDELLRVVENRYPTVRPRVVVGSSGTRPNLTFATHDSGAVEDGALFCCIRGGVFDGHKFAGEALQRGAAALLVDHAIPGVDAVQIVVEDTRRAMGPVCSALWGLPSDHLVMIGITGTNGKTTTSHLLADILQSHGSECRVIGTLTQKRTTPEATELQEQLAEFVASGVTHVVMEVTSHALDLHRVAGISFDTAVFTNLSQDHLDFHGTMEAYFRAKAKLFETGYSRRAVVNVDDTHGHLLESAHLIPTTPYSLKDAEGLELSARGTSFRWRGERFDLPMAGSFNVMNALAAATTAVGLGVAPGDIAAALRTASVPGRYEMVDEGQNFTVVVDFAHTPDGLERVLRAARSTMKAGGRILTVFGCGGDRDRSKRPLMGAIAEQNSDIVVVTSDNPRTEDPNGIIQQILAGFAQPANVIVEPDRRAAIASAFREARVDDVVVLAGKGHEPGQTIGSVTHPFDDRIVAREILTETGRGVRR